MNQNASTEEEVRSFIVKRLSLVAVQRGVTFSELEGGRGHARWKRAFQRSSGKQKPGVKEKNELIHELWRKGLVFIEPPRGKQRAVRLWDAHAGRAKFAVTTSEGGPSEKPAVAATDIERVKAAYEALSSEHFGFVPIYRVRRDSGLSDERFDTVLHELSEQDDPVIDLLVGDPGHFEKDQIRDSFRTGDTVYFRMLWRKR